MTEKVIKSKKDGAYVFQCPGCNLIHRLLGWEFSGDLVSPTFKPSVYVTANYSEDNRKFICHSYIANGKITFLSDCTHQNKDTTLDLLPITEGMRQF